MNVQLARSGSDGRPALIAALAIGVAMILGGSGSPSPLPEAATELLIAMGMGIWLLRVTPGRSTAAREAWLVAALLLVLPAAQLVPLPPALWQALPGREVEHEALTLVGGQQAWRPFSVAPARTLASLLALVPPAALLVMVAVLGPRGRSMVLGTIGGVGLLSLLVGLGQVATRTAAASPFRFYVADVGYLSGFQANHNAAADVLLIAMVAQAAAVAEWFRLHRQGQSSRTGPAITLCLAGLMTIGVFLTASRAGTALLPLAWLGIAAMLLPRGTFSRKRVGWSLGVAGAALAALAMWIGGSETGARILSRYDFSHELRFQLWADAVFAARTYFPWGAGLGTFVPVFLAAEPLESVHGTLPNRAHNDFLELLIEAGVVGYAVLAAILVIIGLAAVRGLRRQDGIPATHACFSLATLSIVAMHSLVDYPLRSISLACLGATAAGMLLPLPTRATRTAHGTMEGRR